MLNYKIVYSKVLDIILLIIFATFLQFIYPFFVYKNYLYMGFQYSFSLEKIIIANIILLPILFFNSRLKGFGYFISTLFIMFLLVPNMVLWEFHTGYHKEIFFFTYFFQVLLIFSFSIRFSRKQIRFTILSPNSQIATIAFISILAILPFIFVYRFNLDPKVLLLKDVYTVRAASKHLNTRLMSYMYSWLSKIIFPVAMILALKYKRKLFFIFLLLAELYLYMTAAQKTVFIAIFLLIFFFFKSYEKQTRYLILGILFIFFYGLADYVLRGDLMVESLFVRRVFLLPALISSYYYDFFINNYVFLSHSIFHVFLTYPYQLQPPHLIAAKYFSHPDMNANTGFIADAFMNFGYVGVFIYSLGVILYFKIIQHLHISHKFAGIFILMVFSLTNSAFLTCLLNHGFILFLVLAMFLLYNSENYYKKI